MYVRTVKTGSGAVAVQIAQKRHGQRQILEHLGSAHSETEVALLKAAAWRKIAGEDQPELDLGVTESTGDGRPAPSGVKVTGLRMGPLIDAITAIYKGLGFTAATAADEVFYQLVAARLVEPTSKMDSLRVIEEMGIDPVSYATVKRRLPIYATEDFRSALVSAAAARADLGPRSLVLFDVSTLYFETDKADGFREPGFSKERRLEPQVTVGLLTDTHGFPLSVHAFEGNRAETKTMLPVIQDFQATYELDKVTVVADAGMLSDANRKALIDAGLSYILGQKIPEMPYVIDQWIQDNPGEAPEDGTILSWPVYEGPAGARRTSKIYYQYRAARARRTLRGVDEQIAKAEKIAAGKAPVKRNRFLTLQNMGKGVNRDLEHRARALAGWKGYITNLPPEEAGAQYVIGAYHQLWHIEKAFRMSKSDLAARPIFHRKKDSIDAHLTVVFAALAVAQRLEAITGWSRKKFITTARRYRQAAIEINGQSITADPELPDELTEMLHQINRATSAGH